MRTRCQHHDVTVAPVAHSLARHAAHVEARQKEGKICEVKKDAGCQFAAEAVARGPPVELACLICYRNSAGMKRFACCRLVGQGVTCGRCGDDDVCGVCMEDGTQLKTAS